MTSNEQQLEELNKDCLRYQQDLDDLHLSIEANKATNTTIDKKLTKIQRKLDDSYNKILNLQEKIALELKARRL